MIDLHTHSTRSDGSESPGRVVELAAEAGCSAVALTDHDTTDGLAEAQVRADELGVRLVPGCEVSCVFPGASMHVLCYFVGVPGSPIDNELAALRDDRERRNVVMAERLGALGLDITYDEALAEAGGTGLGRPHFAALLVRKGHAASVNDAFERYLTPGRPGYVDKTRVEPETICERAIASGALAVVAHPLSLGRSPEELVGALGPLVEAGLAGLECHYGRYDVTTRAELAAIARRLGLVPTGGSDFHGSYKADLSVGTGLGDLDVEDSLLGELEARRTAQSGGA